MAIVAWDGGGNDFNWNNPLNWSGDVLPGSGNDVIIDFGANDFTVAISGGNYAIHSLTSQAAVSLTGGLTVSSSSTLNGLTIAGGALGGDGNIVVTGSATLQGSLSGPAGSTFETLGTVTSAA